MYKGIFLFVKIWGSEIFEMTCCALYCFMLKLWSVSQNVLRLLRELKLPWRQHEESVVPWKSCLQKPAFCDCWLQQSQAVALDLQNWTVLNHRCFYFSIFGQNGLLQESSMAVCFWLLHCFWPVGVCVQERQVWNFFICSLFDVFSTIDCIFHFYKCIHSQMVGRKGDDCSSCRNG